MWGIDFYDDNDFGHGLRISVFGDITFDFQKEEWVNYTSHRWWRKDKTKQKLEKTNSRFTVPRQDVQEFAIKILKELGASRVVLEYDKDKTNG